MNDLLKELLDYFDMDNVINSPEITISHNDMFMTGAISDELYSILIDIRNQLDE